MSGIQDKVVAITGASSGIGEATARLLARRGAKVMLGARRIGRLNALAREIVEAGGSAHYQALDVTQRASMQCFIDEATEVFGRVDVIVNNAGVMPLSMLEELKIGGYTVSPMAVYCATKFAARAISEGPRQEVGGDIRVSVISPGVTESELAESISDPDARERMRAYREVAIAPEAVARAIAFAIEQPE